MYQKNWLKSLPDLSNVKMFAKVDNWVDWWPAIQTNMTEYINPYFTKAAQT